MTVTGLPTLSEITACKFELVDGNVAVVTLNRPERLNTLSGDMHRDLIVCWEEINSNPEIRAGVVTGEGRFFCAGRDIKEYMDFYGSDGAPSRLRAIDDPDSPIFGMHAHHYEFTKPMVAALNGPAAGGGLSLALTCDMLVMADDAYVKDAHAKVNVEGGSWLLWFLPPMIARELAMTDRRLTAEECLHYGLANYVVPRGEVRAKAMEVARATTAMGPDAIRALRAASTEYLVNAKKIQPNRRAEWLERGREHMEALRSHADPDVAEGMRSFLDKREPSYQKPS